MKTRISAVSLFLALAGQAYAATSVLGDELASLQMEERAFARICRSAPVLPRSYSWMSPDIRDAWRQGYKGQGTTITDVDSFGSLDKFTANLDGKQKKQGHGEWTRDQLSLIAPSAKIVSVDLQSGSSKVVLAKKGLNVINASYGMIGDTGYSVKQVGFDTLQQSVISHAASGAAIVVKAAGNDGVAVDGSYKGKTDYLNLALKGTASTIFVGALSSNGSTTKKAKLASYSNYAGSDTTIQNQFLVVGVDGGRMGLYGTSFAAPIVAGYAAILGSKFTGASAPQIANQLLDTARTDTIASYDKSIHGRGEASLSRALAPRSIK